MANALVAPVVSPIGVLRIVAHGHVFTVDELRLIKSVKLVHRRAKADTLTIEIRDPYIEMMDRPIFDPGNRIMVLCGWSDTIVTKGPFIIQTMKPVFPASGEITFTLEATDRAVGEMSKQSRSRSYSGMRASKVLEEKAAQYGLKLTTSFAEEDDILFDEELSLTQSGESDAQFIQRLANKLGYVWGVRGVNDLYFARPEDEIGERIQMYYRTGEKTIKHFEPEMKVFTYGGKKKAAKQVHCSVSPYGSSDVAQVIAASPNLDGSLVATKTPGTVEAAIGEIGDSFAKAVRETVNRGSGNPEAKDAITPSGAGNEAPPGPIKEKANRFGGQGGFSIDGVTGVMTAVEETLKGVVKEASEIIRGDSGGASPGGAQSSGENKDQGKRHAKKALRKKLRMVGGRLVPTVPSWKWTSFETIVINGCGVRCSGRYDVVEATLGFDNVNGLTTELILGKHTIPKKKNKKGCQLGATEIRDSTGNNQTALEQANCDHPSAGSRDSGPRGKVEKEGGILGNQGVVRFDGVNGSGVTLSFGGRKLEGGK